MVSDSTRVSALFIVLGLLCFRAATELVDGTMVPTAVLLFVVVLPVAINERRESRA